MQNISNGMLAGIAKGKRLQLNVWIARQAFKKFFGVVPNSIDTCAVQSSVKRSCANSHIDLT